MGKMVIKAIKTMNNDEARMIRMKPSDSVAGMTTRDTRKLNSQIFVR